MHLIIRALLHQDFLLLILYHTLIYLSIGVTLKMTYKLYNYIITQILINVNPHGTTYGTQHMTYKKYARRHTSNHYVYEVYVISVHDVGHALLVYVLYVHFLLNELPLDVYFEQLVLAHDVLAHYFL